MFNSAHDVHGAPAMLARSHLAALALLLPAGLPLACGSSDEAAAPAPIVPAPPPAPDLDAEAPQDASADAPVEKPVTISFPTVQSRGGKTIATPRVVPIVFAGDPLAAQIASFTQKLATSQYWQGVGAEYGVGPITAAPLVTIQEQPPANLTSTQIEQWLAGKLTAAGIEAPDANTLYAIYYPASVTITLEGGGPYGQSCQGYGGYHFEIAAGGKQVGYAVLPRCSDMKELTVAASHEYFEWATDPFPQSSPAYSKLDDAHWAWQAVMIGELSDLCTFLDRENLTPPEIGFEVQRHWSNKLSLAGKFPCAPTDNRPYLQGVTLAADDALVPDYVTHDYIKTKAVRVPPNGTKEIDVQIYSDQPGTKAVPLRALSYEEWYGGQSKSGFSYKLASNYGKVGDKVKLSVTAPKATGFDLLVVFAYTGPQSGNFWPVLVTNDDGKGIQEGKPSITPETMPRLPTGSRLGRALGRGPRTTMLGQGKRLPMAPLH